MPERYTTAISLQIWLQMTVNGYIFPCSQATAVMITVIYYLHEETQGLANAASSTQDGHLSLRSGRAAVGPLRGRQRLLGYTKKAPHLDK
jgi:hypothetical protein